MEYELLKRFTIMYDNFVTRLPITLLAAWLDDLHTLPEKIVGSGYYGALWNKEIVFCVFLVSSTV